MHGRMMVQLQPSMPGTMAGGARGGLPPCFFLQLVCDVTVAHACASVRPGTSTCFECIPSKLVVVQGWGRPDPDDWLFQTLSHVCIDAATSSTCDIAIHTIRTLHVCKHFCAMTAMQRILPPLFPFMA